MEIDLKKIDIDPLKNSWHIPLGMYNITLCSSSHLVNASSWVSVGLVATVLNRPLLQQNLHV